MRAGCSNKTSRPKEGQRFHCIRQNHPTYGKLRHTTRRKIRKKKGGKTEKWKEPLGGAPQTEESKNIRLHCPPEL